MKKITILTEPTNIPAVSQGDIGVLFYCAADSKIFIQNPKLIYMVELLTDVDKCKHLACSLVMKILYEEPYFRKAPHLTVFKEKICEDLTSYFQVIQLYRFLLQYGYEECEFLTQTWWSDELTKLLSILDSSFSVITPKTVNDGKLKKSLTRVSSGKFSPHVLANELSLILNRLDPFHKRAAVFNTFKNNKFEKGKLWFYTTATNYTNAGLLYESFFPSPFCYLVENPLTGGRSLNREKRDYFSLYHFSSPQFIPRSDEIKNAADGICSQINKVLLEQDELLVFKLFISSQWYSNFFSRQLPLSLYMSAVFENWMEKVEPSALIVGNQVFEGIALYNAKYKNIPTILLQHGRISDYSKHLDYPIDYYLVRGQFFYDRLAPESQKRALILNPPGSKIPNTTAQNSKYIVFITTPVDMFPIKTELDAIFHVVLQALEASWCELIIRVHPLERIVDYKNKISRYLKNKTSKVKIHYHQGPGLDSLIKEAGAIITFDSTVFLDCIRYKTPIIGFNWYEFGFKKSISAYKVFNFAENLEQLDLLIKRACLGELEPLETDMDLFLANTKADELQLKIKSLLGNIQKVMTVD